MKYNSFIIRILYEIILLITDDKLSIFKKANFQTFIFSAFQHDNSNNLFFYLKKDFLFFKFNC